MSINALINMSAAIDDATSEAVWSFLSNFHDEEILTNEKMINSFVDTMKEGQSVLDGHLFSRILWTFCDVIEDTVNNELMSEEVGEKYIKIIQEL